jgi:hypothetical protein
MNEHISWIQYLQGSCICLNDLDCIPGKCTQIKCPYEDIKNVLLSEKKPKKLTLIKSLIKCQSYTFSDIRGILHRTFGPIRTEAVTQRVYDTIQKLKREGVVVFKDSKGVYKTRALEGVDIATSKSSGVRSK